MPRNDLFLGSFSNWPVGITEEIYDNMDAPVGRWVGVAVRPRL